jgi:sulfane dehydrogenase subunit SoxC
MPDIPSRRRFLRAGAALGGATIAGGLAGKSNRAHAVEATPPSHATAAAPTASEANLPPNIPAWSRTPGSPILVNPYGLPARYESKVVRAESAGLTRTPLSSVSFTPLDRLHGIITPNGLHFERHHAGVPDIEPDQHRLMLHGMVKRPLLLNMDQLMRFPSVSRIHFIECGANSGMEWANVAVPTVQFTHGMLSCCEWTGVALSTLLDECGVDAKAKFILAEGADGAGLTRTIPLAHALDDVIVAYAQNGEMLRAEQGYPVRLVVPGFQGVSSVKWLRRIEVGDQPWYTREETSKYTDLLPSGVSRQFTWINEAKSVITSPSGGQFLLDQGYCEIRGLAWSGRGKVKRVDVSVDGGRNWQTAHLQEPVLSKCLTRFRMDWHWHGEPALLQSRVMDETGFVQPTKRQLIAERGVHSVYHNNAIQTWRLDPSGEVSNVQI